MTDFKEKMNSVSYEKLDTNSYTSDEVDKFIKRIPTNTPEEYREFIREFPNSGIFYEVVFFKSKKATYAEESEEYPLNIIFGMSNNPGTDLIELNINKKPFENFDYLFIGTDPFGNYYTMNTSSINFGSIHLHNHEDDFHEEPLLISDSFSEFIDGLYCED